MRNLTLMYMVPHPDLHCTILGGKKFGTLPVLNIAISSYSAVILRTFEINSMNLIFGFVQKECVVAYWGLASYI
jgi:hypothetical protein